MYKNHLTNLLLSLLLLALGTQLHAADPANRPWSYYVLPCRHTEAGKLECLVAKKDNKLELLKNNFTGPAIIPGSNKQINFDAIRQSAHQEIQKLGFTTQDYIYALGDGNGNTRTVYQVFLVNPTKTVTLKNPSDTELVWEDFSTLAPTVGIDAALDNYIRTGLTNRYQRKTVFVDWHEKKGIGFVKQNNRVTPTVAYEPTIYQLKIHTDPYLITVTEIRPTGSDTAEKLEDDTAFERYDLVLTRTPTDPMSLMFAKENPEKIRTLATHWGNQQAIELAQRVPGMANNRALTLLAQGLYHVIKAQQKEQ